jgi:hypothetical protein
MLGYVGLAQDVSLLIDGDHADLKFTIYGRNVNGPNERQGSWDDGQSCGGAIKSILGNHSHKMNFFVKNALLFSTKMV